MAIDEVVRALGGHGELVSTPEELRPALRRAFDSGVATVVNTLIARKADLNAPNARTGLRPLMEAIQSQNDVALDQLLRGELAARGAFHRGGAGGPGGYTLRACSPSRARCRRSASPGGSCPRRPATARARSTSPAPPSCARRSIRSTKCGCSACLAAKTRALLHGRAHVTFDDIEALALPVLRHRVLPSYEATAEGWEIGRAHV